MIEVTDDNFEAEVVNSELPVVVDFWAPWCGPCKMLTPVFEQASTEFEGKVKFVKINVDDCDSLPAKMGIRGVPTLMTFKAGATVNRMSGYQPKEKVVSFVNEVAGE